MQWFSWLLCGILATFTQLRADLVWNTIGFGTYVVAFPVGLHDTTNLQWAVALKPSATYTLTSIALPLSLTTPPSVMTLALVTDANGVPGTPIETFRITDVNATKPTVYTITSVHHPRLNANTQYWIVASATSPTHITWYNTANNSSSNGNLMAFRENGGQWSASGNPYIPGVTVIGNPSKTLSIAQDLFAVPLVSACKPSGYNRLLGARNEDDASDMHASLSVGLATLGRRSVPRKSADWMICLEICRWTAPAVLRITTMQRTDDVSGSGRCERAPASKTRSPRNDSQ
jgi:hypothetical protein